MSTRKSRSREKSILTLDHHIDTLKKLCHEKGCTYYESCPKMCCHSKLGLHTAILWALQDNLSLLRASIYYPSSYIFKSQISAIRSSIMTSVWIAYQHNSTAFTKEQYRKFQKASQYALKLVTYILERATNETKVFDIFK